MRYTHVCVLVADLLACCRLLLCFNESLSTSSSGQKETLSLSTLGVVVDAVFTHALFPSLDEDVVVALLG